MMPNISQKWRIPMDKTAFPAGSFADAERHATGESMTAAERMLWSRRMTKVALGYNFSLRKRDK